MSTEPGTEFTGTTPWDGLQEVCGIVTRVFCTGAQIQLLTECDATRQLLLATDAHQPGALKELFSHLPKGKYYDQTVTWMAFSYTCAYVAKLDGLMSKDPTGTPETLAAQARVAALKDVVARREELRKQYFNDDDPGVLFAGADKPLKDLIKVNVTKGVARPSAEIVDSKLARVSGIS